MKATGGDLYVFRGTRADAVVAGGETSSKLAVTPVTIDPLRATVFALGREGAGKVPGAVFFGSRTELGVELGIGNVPMGQSTSSLVQLELEMGAITTPSHFAAAAPYKISAQGSARILEDMGLGVQRSISTENISAVLRQTPMMTPKQVSDYLVRAKKLSGEGG
jgi:hypothetical protein